MLPFDPPDMTVRVSPGWAVLGETLAGSVNESTVPLGSVFEPPQNLPRIDLVILLPTGEFDRVTGTESESPFAPETPTGTIPLAQIYHRVGATQILAIDEGVQSYIIDDRSKFVIGEAHLHAADRSPIESPDGSRTHFSIQHRFQSGTLDVFVNGVLQEKDVDYTEDVDGRGYTFASSPLSHYRIQHRYTVEYEM